MLLLVAFALLAGPPAPHTLAVADAPIGAFAQDGDRIVWFERGRCQRVRSRRVGSPTVVTVSGTFTCRWPRSGPVRLAVARNRVLWSLRSTGNDQVDYLRMSSVFRRGERFVDIVTRATAGPGESLGGLAGDGGLLVYSGVTYVYRDERACLEGRDCSMRVAESRTVAVDTGEIAFGGRPVALSGAWVALVDGDDPSRVEIRNVNTGSLVTSCDLTEPVQAIALSARIAVVKSEGRLPMAGCRRVVPFRVVPASVGTVAASGTTIVFNRGTAIYANGRLVTRARANPIGLSIEGRRIAWAENVRRRGYVRAVTLR